MGKHWAIIGQTPLRLPTENKTKTTENPLAPTFGSVRQLPSKRDTARKKFGRFQARYTAPNGERVTAPSTFVTKLDADGWLARERRIIDRGEWISPSARKAQLERETTTVGQFVSDWHERQKQRLRLSTWQQYRRVIKNRITNPKAEAGSVLNRFTDMPLNELDTHAVYAWWDAMAAAFPETPETNRKAHVYLRAAMADAVERGLLDANPVSVKDARHKPPPKTKELPTTEELLAVVNAAPKEHRLALIFCLFLGMRIGEVLAVTRENLRNVGTEIEPQWVVDVKGNLQRVQDEQERTYMVWQEPKTKAGKRTVPVFERFNGAVAEHLKSYAPEESDGYLFRTRTGKAIMDTSLRSILERACSKAGVTSKITPHYGRNWLITHLAENGATPAEIGQLLGQTDLKTITETYMKARPENLNTIMGRVGNLLEPEAGVANIADKRREKQA